MKKWNKYIIAGVLASFIWSFIVIPFRFIQAYDIESILITRILFTFLISWIIILVFFKKKLKQSYQLFQVLEKTKKRKNLIYFLASGILLGGNWYTYIFIVNHIQIHSASLTYMIAPILTASLGFTVLKEKINRYKSFALMLAMISITTLGIHSYNNILWVILCAGQYSVFILIQKKVLNIHKLILYGIYISSILMTILIFRFEKILLVIQHFDIYFISIVIIIAFLFTLVPTVINLYSINGLDASTSGILIYVNPICTFLISKIIYHEILSLQENVAYSLIIITLFLFHWKEIKFFLLRKNTKTGVI